MIDPRKVNVTVNVTERKKIYVDRYGETTNPFARNRRLPSAFDVASSKGDGHDEENGTVDEGEIKEEGEAVEESTE